MNPVRLEPLAYIILVTAALAIILGAGRPRPKWVWVLALILLAGAAAGGWSWTLQQEPHQHDEEFSRRALPHQGGPEGYLSSDRCEACHPSQYQSWRRSYHRTMTQVATPETVLANFKPVTLEDHGKTYRLERRGQEFWVELEDPDWLRDPSHIRQTRAGSMPPIPRVWRRLGMLTGSHHMQVFWVPSQFDNLQTVFPFAYLLADQRWVPFRDTFLRDPNLSPDSQHWNMNCLECHSTAGQPRPDPHTRLLDTQVGEFGIACEACHGPAQDHVAANHNPARRYRRHLSAHGDPSIVNPRRLPSKLASQVCGQCHSIKLMLDPKDFQQSGFRYRPGQDLNQTMPVVQPTRLAEAPWLAEPLRRRPNFLLERYWPDGAVRVSGRDYNGLIESPCYQRGDLSCLSCHSMHVSEPNNQVGHGREGNPACLQCHTTMGPRLTEHTHHAAGSSGSQCYNCHMPYTTYGLLKAIRSHQISSPSVATTLRTGRPNACNLCHLDRSLGWTDQYLAAWYRPEPTPLPTEQQAVSAAVLWALRGDAGQRALVAWHLGWAPARRASGEQWLAPFLAQLLADPYAAVRYIAQRSLRQLPGYQNFTFDYLAPPVDRLKAREQILEQWRKSGAPDRRSDAVLIEPNGVLQADRLAGFLRQRDDRSLDLQE